MIVAGRQLVAINLADGSSSAANTEGRVDSVIVSPDGEWVVAGPSLTFYVIFGYRCGADGHLAGDRAWSADPRVFREWPIGFVDRDRFVTLDRNLLVVRDATTGEVRATVKYPSRHYRCSAVSPDGCRFAAMGYDKLYLWDTTIWGEPTRVSGLNRWISAMAFHPTRPIILAVQNLQTLVKFLDTDTGKPIRKFDWKLGEMRSVAFSPDGTLAAAGSASGKIVVWDVDE